MKLTISDLAQVPVPAEPSHQTAIELIGGKLWAIMFEPVT